MSVQVSDWTGLYREGWGQRLRPASYAHPAKNSYGLSVRIYEHALEKGWVKPGDQVVDCFSGIGGFALEALRHGLHFRGVELEQRFVDMAQGCDCTGISKADWARYQGRWDRMRYEGGRHWCPECLMKAAVVAGEREFKVAKRRKIKPLPLPGTKWGALVKAYQATIFDAAPTASYVRNSGKIPCTGAHHYRGNVETWEAQGMLGTAVIVQGDSRRLGEVLERARLCLSSPPFAGTLAGEPRKDNSVLGQMQRGENKTTGGVFGKSLSFRYGSDPQNLGNLPDTGFEAALLLGSPSYSPHGIGHDAGHPRLDATEDKRREEEGCTRRPAYGNEPGQLAQMPEGDLALALSSPPYVGSLGDGKSGIDWSKQADRETTHSHGWDGEGYGIEKGQLAALPPGDHAAALEAGAETGRAQACISSPPFGGSELSIDEQFKAKMDNPGRNWSIGAYSSPANIAHETGSTFWAASRLILEQVYQVLAPGGHAIFVCKRFVRAKKIVEFPLQWAYLCEAVGFTWIHHHKAWLVEDRGAQHTLEGGLEKREVRRLSFFRRLHTQKYPHLAILWEDILCFVKD